MQIMNNQVVYVWNNDGKYSISLSKKEQDGSKTYASFPIRFRKGVEISNKTQIVINNGWLNFYKDKEGKNVFYLFIESYNEVGEKGEVKQDLPF